MLLALLPALSVNMGNGALQMTHQSLNSFYVNSQWTHIYNLWILEVGFLRVPDGHQEGHQEVVVLCASGICCLVCLWRHLVGHFEAELDTIQVLAVGRGWQWMDSIVI